MFLLWIVELKRKEAKVYIICIWSSLYCCFSEALRVAEPKPEARNNNRSLLRSEFFSFTWVLSSFFKFHAVNLAYYINININLNTNNINLLNYITTTTSTSYYEWMLPSIPLNYIISFAWLVTTAVYNTDSSKVSPKTISYLFSDETILLKSV